MLAVIIDIYAVIINLSMQQQQSSNFIVSGMDAGPKFGVAI